MMGIDTKLTGSQILARSLRSQQLSVLFYIMGGPMLEAEASCIEEGLRTIDVRHEAAAVMMAQAYGRGHWDSCGVHGGFRARDGKPNSRLS